MKYLVFISLLLGFSSFSSANPNVITIISPPSPIYHKERVDFNRYGDHLFGYAEVFKDRNGVPFLRVLFSNGTKSKWDFGVNLRCLDKDGNVLSQKIWKKTTGYSIYSAVEHSEEFKVDCVPNAKLGISWFGSKNGEFSLGDVNSAIKTLIVDNITEKLNGGKTVGNLFGDK